MNEKTQTPTNDVSCIRYEVEKAYTKTSDRDEQRMWVKTGVVR